MEDISNPEDIRIRNEFIPTLSIVCLPRLSVMPSFGSFEFLLSEKKYSHVAVCIELESAFAPASSVENNEICFEVGKGYFTVGEGCTGETVVEDGHFKSTAAVPQIGV